VLIIDTVKRMRLGSVLMAGALLAGGCAAVATKGTIPPPGPNGEVDPSRAPDFIAVAGRDGVTTAGYIRKEAVLGAPGEVSWPVYGEDLRTVVGQMVPGKGFVPAGVDPATLPDIPVQTAPSGAPSGDGSGQVVLYVRNDAAAEAWIAIQQGGQLARSVGFWGGNAGVGCFPMSVGARLVMVDRPPDQAGAVVLRALYSRGQEAEPPALWITVGSNGSVMQGRGVPGWWSGGPPAC
jgi:hypothetical protein